MILYHDKATVTRSFLAYPYLSFMYPNNGVRIIVPYGRIENPSGSDYIHVIFLNYYVCCKFQKCLRCCYKSLRRVGQWARNLYSLIVLLWILYYDGSLSSSVFIFLSFIIPSNFTLYIINKKKPNNRMIVPTNNDAWNTSEIKGNNRAETYSTSGS